MWFLSMAGYRWFCKGFSAGAPLTSFLSSKVYFEWSRVCQGGFKKMKRLIFSTLVLDR